MSYGQENVNGIIPAVEAEEVKETMYTSNFRYEFQVSADWDTTQGRTNR